MKLWEIAQEVEGVVFGNKDCWIEKITEIEDADEESLVFIRDKKTLPKAYLSKAGAFLTSDDLEIKGRSGIKCRRPKLAFAKILELFTPKVDFPPGIHNKAFIGEKVKLGNNISIGAYVTIEEGVEIGDNTIIMPNSYIGHFTKIGTSSFIYPLVTIRERILIGNKVKIHSNTVIGSDGFGYLQENGRNYKIPQNGNVVIEDEVEIGSGVTIDRATIGSTIIGRGTKIDNLVHIGHNVKIGKECIIVAQVGISGSVNIGDRVILAGQVGIVDHVSIGSKSVVAARSVVTKNIPENSFVSGFPAKPHKEEQRIKVAIKKLPRYLEKIKKLEEMVKNAEEHKGEDRI